LQCILEGKNYIAPSVQALIDSLQEWPDVKLKPDRRQFEVLVMLCNGNSPDDIADCLHISRKTVDWHIDRLKDVFHVHTRDQLMCMAFYLDIVNQMICASLAEKRKKLRYRNGGGIISAKGIK
jgi:DNA-binding CsgD family transcriptional regulator